LLIAYGCGVELLGVVDGRDNLIDRVDYWGICLFCCGGFVDESKVEVDGFY